MAVVLCNHQYGVTDYLMCHRVDMAVVLRNQQYGVTDYHIIVYTYGCHI